MVLTKGISKFFKELIMNKAVIYGAVVVVLGLLIALGPQFIFKVCGVTMTADGVIADCCAEESSEAGCCGPALSSYPLCHWTAQAEMGIGLLIAALGACMITFTDAKTHLGLLIGIFMASIIAFAFPNFLIGGCATTSSMNCREVAFPALTIESIALFIFSVAMIVIYAMQKPSESGNAA
jgi:hypothetical protein